MTTKAIEGLRSAWPSSHSFGTSRPLLFIFGCEGVEGAGSSLSSCVFFVKAGVDDFAVLVLPVYTCHASVASLVEIFAVLLCTDDAVVWRRSLEGVLDCTGAKQVFQSDTPYRQPRVRTGGQRSCKVGGRGTHVRKLLLRLFRRRRRFPWWRSRIALLPPRIRLQLCARLRCYILLEL